MAEASALTPLPRPGELVDRYCLVAAIAHGGMAAVYAVRREGLAGFDKLLAMKLLLPHLASERRFVDMFLDEARVAAHLQHPNLAQVFDSGVHRGLPYLVMEFLHGKSLSQCQERALELGRPLSQPFLLSVLAAAAAGLHAAHETKSAQGTSLGIVHRDVSPQNIHVGYDGQVKMVDFGIAVAAGRLSSTRTGEVKGKLGFVAPEQLDQRRPIDRRTDLWALGVVAWEAFAGRRLFWGESASETVWKVLNGPIRPVVELSPAVPAEVARVVARCLARDAAQRPATADEVAQVFLAAMSPGAGPHVVEEMEALFALDRLSELAQFASFKATPRELTTLPPKTEVHGTASRKWLFVATAGAASMGLFAALALSLERAPTEAAPASAPKAPPRRLRHAKGKTQPAAGPAAPGPSPLLKSPYPTSSP